MPLTSLAASAQLKTLLTWHVLFITSENMASTHSLFLVRCLIVFVVNEIVTEANETVTKNLISPQVINIEFFFNTKSKD